MQDEAEKIRAVLDVEQRTFEAIRTKDVHALDEILADDFVYRTPSAPDVGKAEFLRNIAALPVDIVEVRGERVHAAPCGEAVVVTGVQRATTRNPDGSQETGSVAFTDVFVWRDGHWRLALAYGVDLPAPERNSDESIAPDR